MVVEHASQCNKSSYIKPITFDLLPLKIFIYNYLSILCGSQKKDSFINDMNAVLTMLLDNAGITPIIPEFLYY